MLLVCACVCLFPPQKQMGGIWMTGNGGRENKSLMLRDKKKKK